MDISELSAVSVTCPFPVMLDLHKCPTVTLVTTWNIGTCGINTCSEKNSRQIRPDGSGFLRIYRETFSPDGETDDGGDGCFSFDPTRQNFFRVKLSADPEHPDKSYIKRETAESATKGADMQQEMIIIKKSQWMNVAPSVSVFLLNVFV